MLYHLAHANIARMRDPLDHPSMQAFVAQLDPINALADISPGFIWRLKDEEGDATAIRVFDDESILINLSVWESLETLRQFAYRGAHAGVMKDRAQWFEPLQSSYLVLWWIPAGQLPTPLDIKERLHHLDAHGSTPFAFTVKDPFPHP